MIIERRLQHFAVRQSSTVQEAASAIAQHRGRIVFVVDDNGLLLGSLTNGDLIRWVQAGCSGGVCAPVMSVANRNYRSAKVGDSAEKIAALLEAVLFVPLLDSSGRLQAVARRREPYEGVWIGSRLIAREAPTFVIAEIGNNHNGSINIAFDLIDAAANAGADCAKFQMRDMRNLYGAGAGSAISENLGTEYVLDLLARFQLTRDELFTCFERCRERGLIPLCTPWDIASVRDLESQDLPAYKVASADLTNHELLAVLADTGKPLLVSTGMATEDEIEQSVQLLKRLGAQFILLHCHSTYPAPFRDIHLNYIERLEKLSGAVVGYSGHERDIFVSIAAVTKGARVVERHITLDRSMEGNDHKVSLLPDEFKRMVEGIRQVEAAFGTEAPRRIGQGEMMNRVTLAKSVFARTDIAAGSVIEEEMLEIRSPGRGLQPNRKVELIGRRLPRDIKRGEPFFPSDLEVKAPARNASKRRYHFNRPWGLPVRHHDYKRLLELSAPDFLEFHLSYRDLELRDEEYFSETLPIGLIVHAPELFAGDHLLDLCSPDPAYRARSINEMRRVINKAHSLRRFFDAGVPTGIVTNVGGFSLDRPLTPSERAIRHQLLADSLSQLSLGECELWPQTMPPYPWHFGGQRFHNVLVAPDDIEAVAKDLKLGVCLDTSHSKLACSNNGWSFDSFVSRVAPYTRHLHIADARALDGEGLQIGEGEIDFPSLLSALEVSAPSASFLPEIWQGHENEGEGFWIALDRLEQAVSMRVPGTAKA